MKFLASFFIIFASTLISAEPLFPPHESCMAAKDKANDCAVVLDENDFLVNASTGAKIFEAPEPTGAISSNWLYRYGNKYILENQNFSSSKTRQWVTFEYKKEKIFVDRIYSFSLEISMQSGPTWYGYECRGDSIRIVDHATSSFSELAITSICGEVIGEHVKVKKETTPTTVGEVLAVSIPVYAAKKINSTATYLFMGNNEPDFFRMVCYSNCALQSKNNSTFYIGRIANSSWFISELQEKSCQTSGWYKYKSSSEKIVFYGCIEGETIKLTEYLSGTKKIRAQFLGKADGDGYKGEWVSMSGDNKRFNFFMFPLTAY